MQIVVFMPKIHNRDYFYKYTDIEAATANIIHNSFRFSSPKTFNDPFDVQFDLHPTFTKEELAEGLFLRTKKFLETGEGIGSHFASPTGVKFSEVIKKLKKLIDSGMIPIEEALQEIKEASREGSEAIFEGFPRFHSEIRGHFEDVAVFCVSEDPTNLLMWSHYANSHKGVVLKLKVNEETDNFLCAADPVSYQQEMPKYSPKEAFLDQSFGLKSNQEDIHKAFKDLVITKASNWSYEKEWRVIIPSVLRNGESFRDFSLGKGDLEQVIFGCQIDVNTKTELEALLKKFHSETQIIQARKSDLNFELNFEPI